MASLLLAVKTEHPETQLILFGELSLGWFWHGERKGRSYDDITAESLDYHRRIAEPIPGPTTAFVARLAREHGVYIAFGIGERAAEATSGSKPYNALVLVDPSGAVVARRRQLRVACGVFQPSDELATIADVDGERVAMLICSDAQSMALLRSIRRSRSHLVLHALAAPQKDALFTRAIAAYCGAWVATSNRIGGEPEPETRYPGMIGVVDPRGCIVRQQLGREGYVVASIPRAGARRPLARMLGRTASDLAFASICLQLLLRSAKGVLRRAPKRNHVQAHG
jgi:predicted amidohydrolase